MTAPHRRESGLPASATGAAVRDAAAADLPAIEAIYDHYVRTSTCTLQTESSTPEQRAAWFARLGGPHPVLVAEAAGELVAWGALVPYAERAGYRHTVEDSIYVRHDRRAKGLGRLVLSALLARADALGHRCIVAKIASTETASLKLHAALGFVDAGCLREAGRKFDRWVDVSFMQRLHPERSGS